MIPLNRQFLQRSVSCFAIIASIGFANAGEFKTAEKNGTSVGISPSRGAVFKLGDGIFLQVNLQKTQKLKSNAKVDSEDPKEWRELKLEIEIEVCTLSWILTSNKGVEVGSKELVHIIQFHDDGGAVTIAGSVDTAIGDFEFSWNQNWTDEVMLYVQEGTKYLSLMPEAGEQEAEEPALVEQGAAPQIRPR